MKFADPKNDLAFKKIFGNEKHKNILISFLNTVLDFKGEKEIVDVKLVNPYQVPKIPELKETILDIKAKNRSGENFIVEMQKKDIGDFAESLYYTSKAYVSQLDKGKDYSKLKKVYFIGILNFNMFENKSFISRHLIINQEIVHQDLKDFEFTFIELPKFNKSLNELETILDKWIYFIKNAENLELIPKEFKSLKEFKEAFEIAKQTAWNKDELEVYEYIALKEADEINALKTAEKKGLQKGIEKGIQKGIKIGKEEGLKEGQKKAKIEIAKKSLKKGLEIEIIVELTGLTIEEINQIKDEL
ncbi:MAG: transposase [Nautilia sp.]|nr:MAG: transposase [Nautilia sp.]